MRSTDSFGTIRGDAIELARTAMYHREQVIGLDFAPRRKSGRAGD
jgi:hypothetical protein